VWTNLGFLYLRLDDSDLANECFLKAQTLDPDHAPAWLGQGVLADKAGDADSARALLAHSVLLSGGALVSCLVDAADVSSRQI
jgi:superkiller protein 3